MKLRGNNPKIVQSAWDEVNNAPLDMLTRDQLEQLQKYAQQFHKASTGIKGKVMDDAKEKISKEFKKIWGGMEDDARKKREDLRAKVRVTLCCCACTCACAGIKHVRVEFRLCVEL